MAMQGASPFGDPFAAVRQPGSTETPSWSLPAPSYAQPQAQPLASSKDNPFTAVLDHVQGFNQALSGATPSYGTNPTPASANPFQPSYQSFQYPNYVRPATSAGAGVLNPGGDVGGGGAVGGTTTTSSSGTTTAGTGGTTTTTTTTTGGRTRAVTPPSPQGNGTIYADAGGTLFSPAWVQYWTAKGGAPKPPNNFTDDPTYAAAWYRTFAGQNPSYAQITPEDVVAYRNSGFQGDFTSWWNGGGRAANTTPGAMYAGSGTSGGSSGINPMGIAGDQIPPGSLLGPQGQVIKPDDPNYATYKNNPNYSVMSQGNTFSWSSWLPKPPSLVAGSNDTGTPATSPTPGNTQTIKPTSAPPPTIVRQSAPIPTTTTPGGAPATTTAATIPTTATPGGGAGGTTTTTTTGGTGLPTGTPDTTTGGTTTTTTNGFTAPTPTNPSDTIQSLVDLFNQNFKQNQPDIGATMGPLYAQQQQQLQQQLQAQAALTPGRTQSGGFGQNEALAMSNLGAQQMAQLGQMTQQQQLAQMQQNTQLMSLSTQAGMQQYQAQLSADLQKYSVDTNADLQKYLDQQDNILKKYGIDVQDLWQRYQADLQLKGVQIDAQSRVDAASLQAAATQAAAGAAANASMQNAQLQYNLGMAGLNVTNQNNYANWILGLLGLGVTDMSGLSGILGTTPGGAVFTGPG